MKLIAYANWHEVEHIYDDISSIVSIGFRCKNIDALQFWTSFKPNFDEIILFGSCGMLQNKKILYSCNGDIGSEKVIKLDRLIAPKRWLMDDIEMEDKAIEVDRILDVPQCDAGITLDSSVRKKEKANLIEIYPDVLIVDQESYILGKWCQDWGIKFQSVRYVIDKCGRIYPPVWNKIWKKRQHRKMQLKFLEVLR